jgi:hypothetical protein
MPRTPVPPEPLAGLHAALTALREVSRDGADELLDQYPTLGDRETQAAVDAFLETAADLLREVDASADELATRVRLVAGDTSPRPEPAAAHGSRSEELR